MPTGGNKITYRHVHVLAKAGWDGWVFHPRDGFIFSGLPGAESVLTPASYQCRASDVLVLPEDAFPGMACERVWVSLDFQTFALVPWEQKRNQIAFLTRKNTADLAQVLKILSIRDRLQGWKFVPIEGLDETGVYQVLGQSRLLVSFGHQEDLCLSNLEALACGCRLIGYDGMAGREYFPATGSVASPLGDTIAFCEAV